MLNLHIQKTNLYVFFFCSNSLCLISLINYLLDLLSIKCSTHGKSSGKTTIGISSNSVTLKKHVPTHYLDWWIVWKIDTSSTIITWLDNFRWFTSSTFTSHTVLHFCCLDVTFWLFACRSNQGSTRLLERSNLITIVAGPSRSYNDSMSFLNSEVVQWIV